MSEPTVCCVKTCTKCLQSKPIEAFGLQKSWNGKRYPKAVCKNCASAKSSEWARNNPDKRRAIWRGHAESNREAYQQSNREYYARNREGRLQAQRDRRREDRVKTNARALLAFYVKTGKILRKPCEKCGSTIRIHGHHHDYTKPLDVVWLCSLCHGKEHRRVA